MARCVASPVRGDLGDAPGLDHGQLLQQVLTQGGAQHLGCNCQQRRNGKPNEMLLEDALGRWVMPSIRSLDLGKWFTISKGK